MQNVGTNRKRRPTGRRERGDYDGYVNTQHGLIINPCFLLPQHIILCKHARRYTGGDYVYHHTIRTHA